MPTIDEHRQQWAGIAPVRVEVGDNLRRPWCWNRAVFMPHGGQWEPQQGHHEALAMLLGLKPGKPRYRWRKWFSVDRCAAWDCSPTEIPAPVRDRYDCRGCRHMPPRARHHFHPED